MAEGAAEGHCNFIPMAQGICPDHSSGDVVFRTVDINCALAAIDEVIIIVHLSNVPDAGGILILYCKLKNSLRLLKPALPTIWVKLYAKVKVVY